MGNNGHILLIGFSSFLAGGVTFPSGFGLGTVLLPLFAAFFPPGQAVATVAVVHLLNNLFKVLLTGRRTDWRIVRRFGLPAVAGAWAGALALGRLSDGGELFAYPLGGRTFSVSTAKFAVGCLLALFTALEFLPAFRRASFSARWLPLGGLLSGFFGGVSGQQGALRGAFLLRLGLSTGSYIATGAVLAALVDLSRLIVYQERYHFLDLGSPALWTAVVCAFLGSYGASRFLKKMDAEGFHRFVGVLLIAMAAALMAGWV